MHWGVGMSIHLTHYIPVMNATTLASSTITFPHTYMDVSFHTTVKPLLPTTSTDRPLSCIDRRIWVPINRPSHTVVTTTSLNGPLEVSPMVGQFRGFTVVMSTHHDRGNCLILINLPL